MKKRELQQQITTTPPMAMGKGMGIVPGKNKMWEEKDSNKQHPQPLFDTGVDELLAVLGYKVRSSDMAEVAQKIDQLEMALGSDSQENELLSHLSSDTVHYNPSDLSTWLESMLSEINPSPLNPNPNLDDPVLAAFSATVQDNSSVIFNKGLDDLRAIPGDAICDPEREKKRLKTLASPQSQNISDSSRAVVLVDSQENGIRLVHTLLACAEAIQQENLQLAEALVNQIGLLAVSQAGAMRKVATYFGEALARRIYRYPQDSLDSTSISELLELHFYETCPYLKFAHFTANQAILEAFEGKNHVHVIDFSMKQGVQWPALIQALALRPGGPPTFRLTAIGPPQPDNTDALQQVGWRLAQLAETVHIEFEYRGFVANSLADIDAEMLNLRANEAVAVNSVFELHKMLSRPGAIEKVLASIVAMKPKIVTMVEQEANHNGLVFLDRFTESLHYYSTLFDSLEGSESSQNNNNMNMNMNTASRNKEDQMMSEVYLGKQIYNVVACEGVERIERHETLSQWRVRMKSAGFAPVHLGSNAFRQASMLLSLFGGVAGYKVEENQGCLTLGWHTRPLIATSAWKLSNGE